MIQQLYIKIALYTIPPMTYYLWPTIFKHFSSFTYTQLLLYHPLVPFNMYMRKMVKGGTFFKSY